MLKIYYHGTNTKKKANSILKNGFNPGTYFADHLEDALYYGGKYVFAVAIDFKFKRGRRPKMFSWQVVSANHISPDKIVEYNIIEKRNIFKNEKLREKVFNAN